MSKTLNSQLSARNCSCSGRRKITARLISQRPVGVHTGKISSSRYPPLMQVSDRWTETWRFCGRTLQPILKVNSTLCTFVKRKRERVYLPKETQPLVSNTNLDEIEQAVQEVHGQKDAWQSVSCEERATMLQKCLTNLQRVAKEAATAATNAHGSYGTGIGEEYSFWVPIALALMEYKSGMLARGRPKPVKMRKRNNQMIADVFPQGMISALFGDTVTEVWIRENAEPTQGRAYRVKDLPNFKPEGRLALVLGAGNHINVVVLDILHKLLCDDDVVIVKMNPQNAFLGPYVRRALAPFFDSGFAKLVYGDIDEGVYLCRHPLVDNIHLTGSVQTFNQITYGTDKPTKDSVPLMKKRITAELSCVTPAIIVPGDWTRAEMEYVASTVVAGLASNSGHSCCALQCLVTLESWPLRETFLHVLRQKLNAKERQVAWYKGSQKRFENFRRQFPDAEELGCTQYGEKETFPWLFASGLTPDQANTQDENWCGVLQEVMLPGEANDIGHFLKTSAEFCNDRCWGSLSCCVIIHPETRDRHSAAFDEAIAALKYGTIIINAPPIFGFLPAAPWGAYPGNPLWDIGSGNCFVHNTSLFDHPEKSVWHCPWQLHPAPLWADITNKDAIMDAILNYIQSPGLLQLIKIVFPALRSSE